MTGNWPIVFVGILVVYVNSQSEFLPKSIGELKHYYDVIGNLEKRGVLTREIVDREKRLCLEEATKLAERTELLTEEEFLTWKQRQIIVSFSNIVAVLAGIIVIIAVTILVGMFLGPWLIHLPAIFWEIIFYSICFYGMVLTSNSWLIFLGCLAFVATISFTFHVHRITHSNAGLLISWICCFVLSIVAIYQQNQEAGYLAVMALESALGFVVFAGQLVIMIGFQKERVIPSATMASFVLVLLGCLLHLQQRSNFLTIPFTRPLLFLGTFVYFIGMIILTSGLYRGWREKPVIFWILQAVAFLSGLAAMFFGPMVEIPFIQAIGGTMLVFWLLEKYVEIAPWTNVFTCAGSLFGFGALLYGFAYFLQKNPEYFIFHVYSGK